MMTDNEKRLCAVLKSLTYGEMRSFAQSIIDSTDDAIGVDAMASTLHEIAGAWEDADAEEMQAAQAKAA
jgi:hypothetical protein